ncbi:MAG: EamA family transporter [Candidatus Chisholmbacteria bacterium]|nr:EamA family transporter [Candidatus Chisholmbacteria bacterium]
MLWLPFALANAFFESVVNAFTKRGAQKIDTLSVIWSHRFYSLFILLPLALWQRAFVAVPSQFWLVALVSTSLGFMANILFVKSVRQAPLSLVLPITAFSPAFLLVTSPLLIGEIPPFMGIIGVLMIVVGSYILNLTKRHEGFFEPLLAIPKEAGSRMMLLATIIWSITSNLDKVAIRLSNPLFYALMGGVVVVINMSILLVIMRRSMRAILKHYKMLAPIGIAAGFSLAAQMTAISMTIVPNAISVKRTSTLFGAVWGKLFFKEEKFRERILGAVIMVLGVIVITIGS